MIARHLAAGQPQIVRLAPADLERRLRDRDDAPAERVGHFEAGVWHGESLMEDLSDCKDGSAPEDPDEQDGQRAAGADSRGELVDFGVDCGSRHWTRYSARTASTTVRTRADQGRAAAA